MRVASTSIVSLLLTAFLFWTPSLRGAPNDTAPPRPSTQPAAGTPLATKTLTVLLVSNGNPFLEKIKTAMAFKQFNILAPADYEKSKPTKYDIVLFDCYTPQFLPDRGNFMYFGCLPPNSKIKSVKEAGMPASIEQNTLKNWKRNHPVFEHAQFKSFYVKSAMKLDVPAEGVERLMEGSKGPLILLESGKPSKHLIVTFDITYSDWPLKISFPVFMYDSMLFLAHH
jgi:hypothetical protein